MYRYPAALVMVMISLLLAQMERSVLAQQQTTITPSPKSTASVHIEVPKAGAVLQGKVAIIGHSEVNGFRNAILEFTYAGIITENWFLLSDHIQPVDQGYLFEWDTTTITDGNYDLRLTVYLINDQAEVVRVNNLRVRNYTPIETDTPTPITPSATLNPGKTPPPSPTPLPTGTPIPPTRTPLPPNPATISVQNLLVGASKGALAIIGFFALLGIYQILHNRRDV